MLPQLLQFLKNVIVLKNEKLALTTACQAELWITTAF